MIQKLTYQFKCELSNIHSIARTYLFQIFIVTELKDSLTGMKFESDKDMKKHATTYFNKQVAKEYEAGIKKLAVF